MKLKAFKRLDEATNTHTVYAIRRDDGGFVDKGGRKTNSIPQIKMWTNKDAAQKYLDDETNIYIRPGQTRDGFKVVPLTVTIEG